MRKCLILLNHNLTSEQIKSLLDKDVEPFYPSREIRELWRNVPTTYSGHIEVANKVANEILKLVRS